jgi:hypothetical protein
VTGVQTCALPICTYYFLNYGYLFISSLDERKHESPIAIRVCKVGTSYHMTSRGNGRNLIYFQTYDFELLLLIV